MNYLEKDIIAIAKRDNNNKRKFLLVDSLQGKHIPVSPEKTFELIKHLSDKVFSSYNTKNLLVIGFAETATAIGALLASYAPFNVNYIHTTREIVEDSDYVFFSEEHSHATEQKLVKNLLDKYLSEDTLIIFAEDEVTTGKTIENIISILDRTYPLFHLRFGVASILNGMSIDKINELNKRNIKCHFILPVPKYNYDSILCSYEYTDNIKIRCSKIFNIREHSDLSYSSLTINHYCDTRKGVSIRNYVQQCDVFSCQIVNTLNLSDLTNKRILIIGTEEFMYAGLHFGHYLEKVTSGNSVLFHATTRSPILPCTHSDYPIKCRYELTSFYDELRTTYIYNLSTYDYVYIITDSQKETTGLASLCDALVKNDCKNITKIVWKY
ncbi:phosphoribosyltransferase domain-containing protein [Aminipila sp.]|uniref:phosphoribosyltransferase domain-containing protein n=1 Tax=Aminipila sp. TaxID=2060095 RepID=UPI00289B6D1B|nr:phosphoribosyltransferase domain-containing protein [Aminipila sp.]